VPIVQHVVTFLATGNTCYNNSWTDDVVNWNYCANNNSAICPNITYGAVLCTNCAFNFDATLSFCFNITDYDVNLVEICAEGDAILLFGGYMQASCNTSDSCQVATKSTPPIYFDMGVPMTLQFTLNIDLGYDIEVLIQSNFASQLSLSGSITGGIYYTPSTGHQWIFNYNLQSNGGGTPDSFDISLYTTVCLTPTFQADFSYIGGPYLSTKFFVENIYRIPSPYCSSSSCPQQTINLGLQSGIGAQLDIFDTFEKNYGPDTLWSTKVPITTGCLSTSGIKRQSGPNYFTQGNTWSGYQQLTSNSSSCSYPQEVVLSAQLVEVVDSCYYFVLSGQAFFGVGAGNCIYQALYSAVPASSNSYTFKLLTTNEYSQDVCVQQCSQSAQFSFVPFPSITLQCDGSGNFYYSDSCISIQFNINSQTGFQNNLLPSTIRK